MKASRLRCPSEKMQGFSLIELLVVTVILVIILGILGQMVVRVQRDYTSQRQLIEAQNNARTAMDTMVRLIRMAGNDPESFPGLQAIDPDPDGNSVLDSIHIQADWNPPDDDLDDGYEDVTFSTNSGTLWIKEGSGATLPFIDSVQSMEFTYFNNTGAEITDPITNFNAIASVRIELRSQVPGSPLLVFTSQASLRSKEP